MAISKIKIENFTVFNDIAVNFNSGINVIMGENGAGKTHLLKLLYSFCNHEMSDEYNKNMMSHMLGCFKNTKPDLFRNPQKAIELKFDLSGKDFHFTIFPSENAAHSQPAKATAAPSVYIPAKDMLTHSKGLLEMAKKYSKDMPFDKTLLDITEKSRQWRTDEMSPIAKNVIPRIENIIGGEIIVENDTFFVQKTDGMKIEFSLEAEGIKKIGLLWQLLMNESIAAGTVLLWDEPEANINPKLIPALVEIMLELSRNGVQIFVATHDYILAKYFEVKRKKNDRVLFHSLYQTESGGVKCESNENFRDLQNNSIITAFDELMDEVIYQNLGD